MSTVQELTPVEHMPLAPPASESAAILSVIERMAANPEIDPERIERYMAMYERMESKKAEQAFNAAMAAAQSEMSVVSVNATNSQTRSKYATYDQIDRALRHIYSKRGFALSFDDGEIDRQDWVRVLCHVSHVGGFTRTYHKDMPADGKGAKGNDVMTKTHAVGAAQQYAMRYLLRMIFNVAVGEDDTDGNMPTDTITDAQTEELMGLIDRAVDAAPDTDRAGWLQAFLEFMKVDALQAIPARDFNKAKSAINDAIRQRAKS